MKSYINKSNLAHVKKGFTMVELLIVIAIMVILTTISLFAVNGAREAARDTSRKNDLQTLASALEVYKADCNYYPNSLTAGNALTGSTAPCALPSNRYLEVIPDDPIPGRNYVYVPQPSGCSGSCTRYKIWAALEDPPASLPAGCSSPPSCGGATCNWCTYNP